MIYVLSISGGKDSAALLGWARRTGLTPRRSVACDTGWESNFPGHRWHEYIAELAAASGEEITVVSAATQFAARVEKYNTFPGKAFRRWCTEELKLSPFSAEIDRIREETGDVVTVVLGIRAEESADRAEMPEREWSDFYDCEVWRPLITWTLEQVLDEHALAGLPLNPLYRLGSERVGCWPCIKSGKREIRLVAENDPDRIAEIRRLEQATGTTMFSIEASRAGGAPHKQVPTPIDEMVAWSKTKRGGKVLAVVREPSGCARWGLCERIPVRDGEDE